jgi:prepilin-type N-terminal cleavage/methylation domain-containing protein
MNKKEKGFTLIEIAIVIVIIGLLAGGVLKGLEILEDSRTQKAIEQMRSLQSAWFGYISRYQQIPGNDSQAQEFFGTDATNGDGDGTLSETEQPLVWQHLHLAGIIQGSGNNATSTPWGNAFSFSYDSTAKQHLLCIANLLGSRAIIIDRRVDDGTANTGTLFGSGQTEANYDAETTYTFCSKL